MRRIYLIVTLALFAIGGIAAFSPQVAGQMSTTQGGTPSVVCATPATPANATPTVVSGAGIVITPTLSSTPQDSSGRMAILNDCATAIAASPNP